MLASWRAERHWTEFLPDGEVALTQMGGMYVLTSLRGETLDDFELSWFDDPRVWPIVAELRGRLVEIEAGIDAANAERPMAYDYLRPSLVTVAANV